MKTKSKSSSISDLGSHGTNLASFILIGKALTVLFTGISFIVVARILGPQVYGVYTLAMGIIGVTIAYSGFLGTALNKFISQFRSSGKTGEIGSLIVNTFFILVLISALVTLIVVLLSGYLATYVIHSQGYAYVIVFAALTIVFTIGFDSSYNILIGLGESTHLMLLATATAIIQAVASIALALAGFGAVAPILGFTLAMGCGIIAVFYTITRKLGIRLKPEISGEMIKKILNFSVPVGLANTFTIIGNNIGIAVLGVVATTVIAGNFGIASKISSIMDIVVGSVFMASISTFSIASVGSQAQKKIGTLYNYSLYIALVVLTPLLLYLAVLAAPFTITIFSGYYQQASTYIMLTAIGLVVWIFGNYAKTLLISVGKSKELVVYGIITTIIELISIAILVPTLHAIGLVISLFYVTTISDAILFSKKVKDVLGIRINEKAKMAKVLLANVITAALLIPGTILLAGINIPLLVISLIIYLLAYPPILVLTGALAREDTKRISGVTAGIPFIGWVVKALSSYAAFFIR